MNTVGKTNEGEPLSEISITEMEEPPVPPEDSSIIGLTYDLGPDGATFDPAITLTFTYDPADIPEGVDEGDLAIAMWDEESGEWIELTGCTVDPVTHTIIAPVSHFTAFTVLSAGPAAFTASELNITPAEVNIGGNVTISVLVTNTGDLTGSYEVGLVIADTIIATEEVSLAGGESQTVTFTTYKDFAGTYEVGIDELSGTFIVKAALTPTPTPTATPTATPTPTPTATATATPTPTPPAPTPLNWWLIGGIIAAVMVIGVVIALIIRRRRESSI